MRRISFIITETGGAAGAGEPPALSDRSQLGLTSMT